MDGQLFLLQLSLVLDQPMFAIIGALSTAQANVQLDGIYKNGTLLEQNKFFWLCNPKLNYTIPKKDCCLPGFDIHGQHCLEIFIDVIRTHLLASNIDDILVSDTNKTLVVQCA